MSNKIQSCLSSQVLEQIGRNEVSPDELLNIEEHVSECPYCREMFDSHYSSSQWSELIQPALSDSQLAVTSAADDGAYHSSAILKLLGPTDDPNMLGRIGNYEIVGVIGQGGMGAVFKGFDRSLNRFVAIKMLLPHLAASGAARKRFAREGQAVAAVVDDHVMAIHCVDQWQGIPYLVMTYSRGVSLQKRLNDSGPLEVREILRIGMQAAKGLAAAHAQGIVHRDIKPSNILLDQNVERVQLVDFGLARAVDDASLTCSGTLAGTPQYMSPEQARAEMVDHRSDLFSLGSVLYAMCVGHAPFRAESSYSVLRLIIEKEPRPIREINSDIPEWLCVIIGKLMAKHANDRFDSAKQVAELLEACLAHVQQPTTVPLPPSVARLSSIEIPKPTRDRSQNSLDKVDNRDRERRYNWGQLFYSGNAVPPIGKCIAAAAAAAAFLLAGVVIVLELNKGTLTIKSVADNVPIRILQGKDTVQELTVSKQGTTTRLRAGTYTIEIEGDSTAYEIQGDNVTVKRGEVTLVDISIGHATVVAMPKDHSIGLKHDDAGTVHWGKPDENGLQAGVRLSPPLKRYQVGQKINVELLYRNIFTKPIPALVPDFPVYKLEVHNTNGAMVEVSDTQKLQSESGSRTENISEQPIAFESRPLLLLDSSTSSEKRVQALSQADEPMLVFLSPGQSYRLQFKVRSLAVDASGIMKTGKVEFAVDAPVSQGASISFDQELGLATIKGSKAEVQRTAAVLETMLKQLPNADTKSDASQTEAKGLPGAKAQGEPKTHSQSDSPVAVVMVMHPAELQNGNTIQRAAATKTLSLLADNDVCGILSYGYLNGKSQTTSLWGDGPVLQKVGEHRQDWNTAIAKSMTGDFPNFEPAFQLALDAFKNVDAKHKLMIVFTDGDPVFMDESIVGKFRDAKIKVSVVHVDIHRIHQSTLLKQLVDSTDGTYLYALASQAGVVESFFVNEVQKLRADVRPALKKIGLAFQNFHTKTGKFPGSRMIHLDRQGKEFKHPFSWRVAILPYIGEQQLFDEYRFDEAWDSENNTKLLSKMPEIYGSPHAAVDQPIGHSNLLGFATDKGGLGLNSGEPMSSFKDGTSNTILIVETAQSVPWTKPEDLTDSTVRPILGQPLRYILADGSIGEMDPVDAKKLEKMMTRNGQELLD